MTPNPRSIKFWAMGRPILPRPITPTLSMPKLYVVWSLDGKGSDGETACSSGLGQGRPAPGTETGRVRISPVRGPAVGRPPFGGHDEQRPPVRAAEHYRERRAVLAEFDALQDLAALGDADDRGPAGGDPDRAFGVGTDAVRAESLGEDPPVGQPAVRVDVERGEPAGEGLGDDQRPVVGRNDHAVRELDVVRNLAQVAVGREELDVAGLGCLATREVEVRAVEVDVAARVHDDLVRLLLGDGDHRPVGLLAP